jgi:hypothetical protein
VFTLPSILPAADMSSAKVKYFLSIMVVICHLSKSGAKTSKIDEISDHKDFKKLLKTKNNVLVCFHEAPKNAKILTLLAEVSEKVCLTNKC